MTVYYQPDRPELAVLEPGIGSANLITVAASLLPGVMVVGLMVRLMR